MLRPDTNSVRNDQSTTHANRVQIHFSLDRLPDVPELASHPLTRILAAPLIVAREQRMSAGRSRRSPQLPIVGRVASQRGEKSRVTNEPDELCHRAVGTVDSVESNALLTPRFSAPRPSTGLNRPELVEGGAGGPSRPARADDLQTWGSVRTRSGPSFRRPLDAGAVRCVGELGSPVAWAPHRSPNAVRDMANRSRGGQHALNIRTTSQRIEVALRPDPTGFGRLAFDVSLTVK